MDSDELDTAIALSLSWEQAEDTRRLPFTHRRDPADTSLDEAIALSLQEARSEKIFSGADSNSDGTLTADELAADMAAHAPRGDASGTDAATRAADLVTKADADGDGALSLDEFKAAAPPPPPPPGGGQGPKEAATATTDAASTSDPLDTNGDGKVSMAELLASLQTTESAASGVSTEAADLLAKLIAQLTSDAADSASATTALAA